MCYALAVLFALAATGEEQPEKQQLPSKLHTKVVIHGTQEEVGVDRRDGEVFQKTLFNRDDQLLQMLSSGINAGQHEGGGKSVEIRRFGFNLDHGGANGGLKILVDNVQQNQGTQGHGQGYLGSLKSLSPELVEDITVLNGPFSAEYGDFSGLGVVQIRLRESLPDEITARIQGGAYGSLRGFLGFSPSWKSLDALFAYEGSTTDGPFLKPLDYRRDNITGSLTKHMDRGRIIGLKWNAARNTFSSSGQLPLDLVAAGKLDRFGSLDAGDGGRVRMGRVAGYYSKEFSSGTLWKVNAFANRSLFDLYSNFTFALNDAVNGDGIQQHDSRLDEGGDTQLVMVQKRGAVQGLLTIGGNVHASQINVGLYPRLGRTPLGVQTRAQADITNGGGYLQQAVTLWNGRLVAGAGLRFDTYRYTVADRVETDSSGSVASAAFQPKANIAFTPWRQLGTTFSANYGRAATSLDARSVIRALPDRHLSATSFYQAGVSQHIGRISVVSDLFWIDRSNEIVYVPDDGSIEYRGPTRSYGFEVKASAGLTKHLSINGGFTRVLNSFYRGTAPREYVDSAPHFTSSAALTVAALRGWSGSLRVRAINSYRLDPVDASKRASGNTVLDLWVSRQIRKGVELHFSVDNLTDRAYYETQNYFESQVVGMPAVRRIHGTPGYPVNASVGVTFRLRGK